MHEREERTEIFRQRDYINY